jgi:hypothetical protein
MEERTEMGMKRNTKEKSKAGRADEFILFAVFRAFDPAKRERKKFSLDLLFLLGQGKRKAEKKKNMRRTTLLIKITISKEILHLHPQLPA